MILVGQFDSPFVRRVAVTLHHYGMAYVRNPLSVFGDFEGMSAINPLRRVPSLVLDDGEVLIDSSVIVDHLDEMSGDERTLCPRGGARRRRILKLATVAAGISDKVVQLSMERMFHDQPSATFEARLSSQISESLIFLNDQCTDQWLCGGFSHADIMAGCMLGHLRLRLPEFLPAEKYKGLERLQQSCEALPSFAAAAIGANETVPTKL